MAWKCIIPWKPSNGEHYQQCFPVGKGRGWWCVRPLGWVHLHPIPPNHGFQGSAGLFWESYRNTRVARPSPENQHGTPLGMREATEAQGKLGQEWIRVGNTEHGDKGGSVTFQPPHAHPGTGTTPSGSKVSRGSREMLWDREWRGEPGWDWGESGVPPPPRDQPWRGWEGSHPAPPPRYEPQGASRAPRSQCGP